MRPDIVGYGETILHYTWGRVPDRAIERVRGKNPAEFLGDDSLGAGLQMALYDLVGKALGVPAYRLFNLPQVRAWCPISWWNIDMPPDANAAEAQEAVAQGYTSYKIKVRPWWDVYAQVEAISAVTPPHFRLDLDWNNMLLNQGNAAPVLTRARSVPACSDLRVADHAARRRGAAAAATEDHAPDRPALWRATLPDRGSRDGL